jgi:hypothetical protein
MQLFDGLASKRGKAELELLLALNHQILCHYCGPRVAGNIGLRYSNLELPMKLWVILYAMYYSMPESFSLLDVSLSATLHPHH